MQQTKCDAGGLLLEQYEVEKRVEVSRRCAWCLRFCVGGVWIPGRRAGDGASLSASTHTICEDCIEDMRRQGMSV